MRNVFLRLCGSDIWHFEIWANQRHRNPLFVFHNLEGLAGSVDLISIGLNVVCVYKGLRVYNYIKHRGELWLQV